MIHWVVTRNRCSQVFGWTYRLGCPCGQVDTISMLVWLDLLSVVPRTPEDLPLCSATFELGADQNIALTQIRPFVTGPCVVSRLEDLIRRWGKTPRKE